MSYCDTLITAGIALDCTSQLGANGYEAEGVILNRSDIDFVSSSYSGNTVTSITLTSETAKGYQIVQPAKNPFTGTISALEEGTYYNTFTHSVSFVILNNDPDVAAFVDAIANGEFVIILERKSKNAEDTVGSEFVVYGWHQGLAATETAFEAYSDETHDGWKITLTEAKSPSSTTFVNYGTYATTKAAVQSLYAE